MRLETEQKWVGRALEVNTGNRAEMGGKGLEVYSSSLEIKNSQKRVNREEI